MKVKKILECTMIGVSVAAMTAVLFGNIEFLASSSINLVGAIILHYLPKEETHELPDSKHNRQSDR